MFSPEFSSGVEIRVKVVGGCGKCNNACGFCSGMRSRALLSGS